MPEIRRWTSEDVNGGRVDTDGIEWFACDPYPTWYRWEGMKLHHRSNADAPWMDEQGAF